MITHIIVFLILTLSVGAVNLSLSEPLERPFPKEFLNYALVVAGGIMAFTALIMTVTALFL